LEWRISTIISILSIHLLDVHLLLVFLLLLGEDLPIMIEILHFAEDGVIIGDDASGDGLLGLIALAHAVLLQLEVELHPFFSQLTGYKLKNPALFAIIIIYKA
jgi:hypothetical protein